MESIRVGSIIAERYRVEREAGRGNFAQVFICEDRSPFTPWNLNSDWNSRNSPTKHIVAVKLLKRGYERDAMYERDVLKQLNDIDPRDEYNTVKMIDFFTWAGHSCFTFTLKGNSLKDVLDKSRMRMFSKPEVMVLARDLGKATFFIHDCAKVIHTDLKPENILLHSKQSAHHSTTRKSIDQENAIENHTWCLCDFGSASFVRCDDGDNDLISTRPYRSPEVILGSSWSTPSDMWSVGCILFEAFSGIKLFDANTDNEHLTQVETLLGTLPNSLLHRGNPNTIQSYAATKGRRTSSTSRQPSSQRRRRAEDAFFALRQQDSTFYDLLRGLLSLDPAHRMTGKQLRDHDYCISQISTRSVSATLTPCASAPIFPPAQKYNEAPRLETSNNCPKAGLCPERKYNTTNAAYTTTHIQQTMRPSLSFSDILSSTKPSPSIGMHLEHDSTQNVAHNTSSGPHHRSGSSSVRVSRTSLTTSHRGIIEDSVLGRRHAAHPLQENKSSATPLYTRTVTPINMITRTATPISGNTRTATPIQRSSRNGTPIHMKPWNSNVSRTLRQRSISVASNGNVPSLPDQHRASHVNFPDARSLLPPNKTVSTHQNHHLHASQSELSMRGGDHPKQASRTRSSHYRTIHVAPQIVRENSGSRKLNSQVGNTALHTHRSSFMNRSDTGSIKQLQSTGVSKFKESSSASGSVNPPPYSTEMHPIENISRSRINSHQLDPNTSPSRYISLHNDKKAAQHILHNPYVSRQGTTTNFATSNMNSRDYNFSSPGRSQAAESLNRADENKENNGWLNNFWSGQDATKYRYTEKVNSREVGKPSGPKLVQDYDANKPTSVETTPSKRHCFYNVTTEEANLKHYSNFDPNSKRVVTPPTIRTSLDPRDRQHSNANENQGARNYHHDLPMSWANPVYVAGGQMHRNDQKAQFYALDQSNVDYNRKTGPNDTHPYQNFLSPEYSNVNRETIHRSKTGMMGLRN